MPIVSNLHEMLSLFSGKNKNISKKKSAKILSSMQSINQTLKVINTPKHLFFLHRAKGRLLW